MRKLGRVLLIFIGVLVLALVALRLLISPEDIKREAFKQLQERTGLIASADEVGVSFPWPIGVRLQGFKLASPEGGLEDGTRLQLDADEVFVSAELMSLIKRSPRVNEVRLLQPRAELWLPPREEAVETEAAASTTSMAPGMAVALGLLSIEDGHFVVHQPEGGVLEIAGLQQTAHMQLKENNELSGRMSTVVESIQLSGPEMAGPVKLPRIDLEVRVLGNLDRGEFTIAVAKFQMMGARAEGDIDLKNVEGALQLDTRLRMEAPLRALFESAQPYLTLEAPLDRGFAVESGAVQASFTLQGPIPDSSEDPLVWLDMLKGQGSFADLRVTALGHKDIVAAHSGFELEFGTLQLKELTATLPGAAVTGNLELPLTLVGNLGGKLDLKLQAGALLALGRELWPQLPAEFTEGTMPPAEWPGVAGNCSAQLELKWPLDREMDPELTPLQWSLEIGRIAYMQEGLSDSVRITGGRARGTMLKADVYDLNLASAAYAGVVNGSAHGWPEQPIVVGIARMKFVDLDLLAPPQDGEERAWLQRLGPRVANAAAKEPEPMFVPPANLDFRATVEVATVRSQGYTLENVKSRAFLAKQRMNITELNADMGGGKLSATGEVDWTVQPPHWKVDGTAADVPATTLFAPFAPRLAEALATGVSGEFEIDGPISADAELIRASLGGQSDLRSSKGELNTLSLLGDALSSLPGKASERFKVLPFSSLATHLRVEAGKVFFDDLLLKGPTSVSANGWVGLDGRVDYGLAIKLPPGEKLDLGAFTSVAEFLRESDGRITIPVRVSGPSTKPKVAFNFSGAEQKAKDQIKEDAQGAIKDTIRNLLGGDATAPTTPDSAAVSPEQELKDKAEGALDDLLGGLRKKKKK